MNRFAEIEICGKKYPLICNINVMRQLSEKFGEGEIPVDAGAVGSKDIDDIVFILYHMIDQGVKAKARLGETGFESLSMEDIGLLLGMNDIQNIMPLIMKAQGLSRQTDVDIVPDPKNAEAEGTEP